MNRLHRYFARLELPLGASPQEIRRAYRDLVKVWHPDRFAHEPRLQHRAQEKLKALNEAYAVLMSGAHISKKSTSAPGAEFRGTRSGSKTTNDPYGKACIISQVISESYKSRHKIGGLFSYLFLVSLLLLLLVCAAGSPQPVVNLVRQWNQSTMVSQYFYFIVVIWGVLVGLFVESLME